MIKHAERSGVNYATPIANPLNHLEVIKHAERSGVNYATPTQKDTDIMKMHLSIQHTPKYHLRSIRRTKVLDLIGEESNDRKQVLVTQQSKPVVIVARPVSAFENNAIAAQLNQLGL